VVDEEATKKAQEEADAKAKEEGKEGADPVSPGQQQPLLLKSSVLDQQGY
jgi:hypothetical protein